MASKAVNYWRSMARSARHMTTATAPRTKPFAPAAADVAAEHPHARKASWARGEFVPVYVALGLIALSLSLGAHTAKQQLAHAPDVRVRKSKRETVPEVVAPDQVADEADRFVRKSFFRRIAHAQDMDAIRAGISDPTRPSDPFRMPRKVEDLRTVGVDPRA